MAGSFFQLLKREKIRRRTCRNREEARRDVFDCTELFYNPKCRHTKNGMPSSVALGVRPRKLNRAGV